MAHSMQTLDFALARSRPHQRENQFFQFRAEAFNALNKVNLGTPNRYVNTPQFGTITMAMTPGREIAVERQAFVLKSREDIIGHY